MSAEYLALLDKRVQDEEKRQQAILAKQEKEQEAWRSIFSTSEALLEERGQHQYADLRTMLYTKYAWLLWMFHNGWPPFKHDEASRLWSFETEITFDDKEPKVLKVAAFANKNSPRNAYKLQVEIGKVYLVLKRSDYTSPIYATLVRDDQEMDATLGDATFFQSALQKARP